MVCDVLMIHGLKFYALAFCLDMGFVYLLKLSSSFLLVNLGSRYPALGPFLETVDPISTEFGTGPSFLEPITTRTGSCSGSMKLDRVPNPAQAYQSRVGSRGLLLLWWIMVILLH